MERQDAYSISLTDAQVAEVEGRLAKPHKKFVTLEQARNHFSIKGA